jgi:hypothetical protein
MKLKKTCLSSAIMLSAVFASSANAAGESPWLPGEGDGSVSFSYGQQTADRFYVGDTEAQLPTDLELSTGTITLSYGITDRVAFDARVGYASSDFLTDPGLAPQGGLSGITDSRFGLRYKFYETESVVFTLNGAANIQGSYDTGAITAIGDGSSSAELGLLLGFKSDGGFYLSGEAGYRAYGNEVPDEWFANISGAYAFNDRFAASLGYQVVRSDGDLDVGGPGFSPARFPELDEDYDLAIGGVSFNLNEQWAIGAGYGRKLDGRNTAKSDFWNVSLDYSF